jgi:ribokinase
MAFITVDGTGENMIVVSPGANATMSVMDIERTAEVIAGAGVLLLQLEIPLEVVHHAAAICRGIVVLNPAPAAELSAGLLESVDILVPNRTELALLTGSDPADTPEAIVVQNELLPVGAGIVTLGADGALVRAAGETTRVPAPVVTAIDATAAGDAFCAGLADALADGATPLEAARWGVRVGAAAATRAGAQASLPTRAEVNGLDGDI